MKVRSALTVALVVVCCAALARAAVIGIDYGSEFIKVAIVQPGKPFHIVVDETAKRKVPAMVAFDKEDRMVGTSAQGVAVRCAHAMYAFMHTLLGKSVNSPAVDALRRLHYPYEFVPFEARHVPGTALVGEGEAAAAPVSAGVGVKHSADLTFQPEDLVAMNFQQIKKISELDAGGPVKDCVITVPPFYTQTERQALIDAAEIAGLNVLALVNENTASAVQYGIDRTYTEADITGGADGNSFHQILLYNMGTSSTKVSLVQYSAYNQTVTKKEKKTVGQMEVRGVAYDELLGGRDFDGRLVDLFASEFTAQIKKKGDTSDIYKMPRVMAKFREAANKAKTVLSANVETVVAIAGVFADYDFKMTVTRDKFVEITKDLVERSIAPVRALLEEAGGVDKALPKISKVIIIGGGSRVPAIQNALKTLVNRKTLDQPLDSDESAAMGAAFMAANMSTAFRVRPFGMTDVSAFPVGVRLSNVASADTEAALSEEDRAFSKRATLFSRYNKVEKRKTVAFSNKHDIAVAMHYDSASKYLPKGVSPALAVYNVTGVSAIGSGKDEANLKELLTTQKPRVSLKFVLDASGIAELVRADATLEDVVKVPVEKVNATAATPAPEGTTAAAAAAADDKKDDAAAAGDKKEDTPAAPPVAEKTPEELEAEKAAKAAADAEAGIFTEVNAEGVEVQYRKKKRTYRFDLTVSKAGAPGSVPPLTTAQKNNIKAYLAKLAKADERKAEIAAAKNAVESFIYGARARLDDDSDVVYSVTSEEQRDSTRSELSAAEDWLSMSNNADGSEQYDKKLEELKKLTAPMFFRAAEVKDRPLAINSTQTIANYTRHLITKLESTMPWVTAEERKELLELVEGVESWLSKKQAEQEALQPYDTPAFTSEQLLDKLRPIARTGQSLLKKKAPPKPKPAKDATVNATATANATADASSSDAKAEPAAADAKADSAADAKPADGEPAAAASSDAPAGDAEKPPAHTEL